MRKTSLELTDEQYFYLQEKVLARRRQGQMVSMAYLVRELIDRDREMAAAEEKKQKGAENDGRR